VIIGKSTVTVGTTRDLAALLARLSPAGEEGDEEAAVMASRARRLVRSTYSAAAMARAIAGQYADVTGGGRRSDEGGTAVRPSRIRIPS
ncbi:hypothetical protein ABZ054_19165, partial [Streptomyces sp. NPDC006324]